MRSWEELNAALYERSWRRDIVRFRSSFAFRGVADAAAALRTGLTTLGGDYERLESHLLASFRKYAHRDAAPGDSVWNWLAVAQHHGLPTRLVDWTYSPYVAAHFATADVDVAGDRDGVVWCVDFGRTNRHLPPVLRRILRTERVQVFTADLLGRAASTLRRFDRLARREFVVFLEPPSLDQRIVNQFALFSVLSSARGDLARWLAAHPELHRRVVIPAAVKWEIRDKLDQANITERLLFPGLDGLARWLGRYYAERRGDGRRPAALPRTRDGRRGRRPRSSRNGSTRSDHSDARRRARGRSAPVRRGRAAHRD